MTETHKLNDGAEPCEFCDMDEPGNADTHAPRCPVHLESQLTQEREAREKAEERAADAEELARVSKAHADSVLPALEVAEAGAAAMRDALRQSRLGISEAIISEDGLDGAEGERIVAAIDAALSSDAGRALLERVERLEKALDRIANPQCGCHPKCQCLEPGQLAIFREEVLSLAREALRGEKP